jgi:hypothetical protein
MTDKELIAALSATHVVALTLYGETSNQPLAGTLAVASVIQNRARAKRHAWGLTPREVCLAPFQFSCWTPAGGGAPNYLRVVDAGRQLFANRAIGPALRRALDVAGQLVAGALADSTSGSTHYMTVQLYESDVCPTWAFVDNLRSHPKRKPTCRILDHVFFSVIS